MASKGFVCARTTHVVRPIAIAIAQPSQSTSATCWPVISWGAGVCVLRRGGTCEESQQHACLPHKSCWCDFPHFQSMRGSEPSTRPRLDSSWALAALVLFAWVSKQLLTWALQCASALTRGSRPVPCLCFRLWSQPHGAARLHHGYAGRQRHERDDLCGRLRLHDCGRRRVPRSPFVCCLRLSSCFKSTSSRSSTRTPGLNAAALTLSHGALAGRRGAVLHDGLREEDG